MTDRPRWPSILFTEAGAPVDPGEPDCFEDLHLDAVSESIVTGWDADGLHPYLRMPLTSDAAVDRRHAVFADLERAAVRTALAAFVKRFRRFAQARNVAANARHRLHAQGWTLHAALLYCDAVERLDRDLADAEPAAPALRELAETLGAYVRSRPYLDVAEAARAVDAGLGKVRYRVRIDGDRVEVTPGREAEEDYAAEVVALFERFRAPPVHVEGPADYGAADMNQVEARVLDIVAGLAPEPFAALDRFCAADAEIADPGVERFQLEAQLYLAVAAFRARLAEAGLEMCMPEIVEPGAVSDVEDAYDVALALQAIEERSELVANGWRLGESERIMIVSGPNQGGKTTFARSFGQVHYLAALGFPVPGRSARLVRCERVMTHFERAEDVDEGSSGKLEADAARIASIIDCAGPRTVVVMNESFSSTSLQDALELGGDVLRRLAERRAPSLYVTFMVELADIDPSIVSMVAGFDPEEPEVRTFRIVRRPADGRAFAEEIARRYRLDYESLRERIR